MFGRLADRFRHFTGLARTVADAALLVADDDQRGKAETPTALHHLGNAVDADQLVDKLVVAAIAAVGTAVASVGTLSSSHCTQTFLRNSDRLRGPRQRAP